MDSHVQVRKVADLEPLREGDVLKPEDWLDLARKLDWEFSYVAEADVYPEEQSGRPWLGHEAWANFDEPYRTTYTDYIAQQRVKDASIYAVKDVVGKVEDVRKLPAGWVNALKLHTATLPLAEFTAVVGNLRAARFGRDSAWRTMATLGALDEFRHTQIPLVLMHELVKHDVQFDWTHKFYHSNNWVAIAARHLVDELLLTANPIEFAIGGNVVFETGFTNLQFIGLSALAHSVGDSMFEKMVGSIQSDEARHSQIGPPVLAVVAEHDREYAQYLLDKWFWRSWLIFATVTGFSMDYLTPIENRPQSFREFVEEWVIDQYLRMVEEYGLKRPWYWDTFLESLDHYHHMLYATAYTYRASVWFDFVLPGPRERAWLAQKYPRSWDPFDRVWETITQRWRESDPGNDFAVHGTAIVTFCDLCQLPLSNGTPQANSATILDREGRRYVFCSKPCRWIFEEEPKRYAQHKNVVQRVLAGEAPANLIGLVRRYFGLDHDSWGKDAFRGAYPWLQRKQP